MATVVHSPAPAVVVDGDLDSDFLLRIPENAHSLAGFRKWALSADCPEKLRVTFLDGMICIDMSKEEILTHASVKTAVGVEVGALVRDLDLGDIFINGVRVTNLAANVSNNPDMVAILWQSLASGKVHYVTTRKQREVEIEGSPDWILEIVSDSSVIKDTEDLRHKYHQANVREYWLIDARGDDIVFQVLYWRKSGYVAAPNRADWQRSRVFERSFQLTRNRDRRGGWRYTLSTKEE